MEKVRIGIVGLGNMGSFHVSYFNTVDGAVISALCDADASRVEKLSQGLGTVGRFSTYQEMLDSRQIDAVVIATPHFQHGEIARYAFSRNVHVLCEKPVAVTVKDARQTNEAHAKSPQLKYQLMFQQRTNPLYVKMRELIRDGELGAISRITWIVTDWFRTWSYYASGGWRGTWSGEGGGVLMNQCPHNLDLLQWVTGLMPSRITAVANIGKTHPIEVEDEVSAILEYPGGAFGHFITTTGEAPGTNRFEIAGDRGKLVAESGKITFTRTRKSVREIREKDPNAFVTPEAWTIDIPIPPPAAEMHKIMSRNFINAILNNEPLIGPGVEGVKGLEIGNAMLMAGLTRTPVDLPLDSDRYEQFLRDCQQTYAGRKNLTLKESVADIATSWVK